MKKMQITFKISVVLCLGVLILSFSRTSEAAFINFTGFETGDTSEAHATVGLVSVVTAKAHTGTYSLHVKPLDSDNRYYFANHTNGFSYTMNRTATTYYVFYLKMDLLPPSGFQTIFGIDNNSGVSVADLRMDNTGNLYIIGATGSDSAGVFTVGGPYRKVSVSCTTNASCSLSVDDGPAQIITANNVTQDRIFFGSFAGTYDAYFDDVAISDAPIVEGGRVVALIPDSAGASAGWSTGTSTLYSAVSEIPPNGDTSYVATSTIGQRASYNLSLASTVLSWGLTSVKALGVVRDEGGVSSLAVGIDDPSGVGVASNSVDPGAVFTAISRIQDTNPGTGGVWTGPILDNERIYVHSNASVAMRATSLYLMVWGAAAPRVVSPTKASITASGATLGANANADGASPITARGICYSSTDNIPQMGEGGVNCVQVGSGRGVYTTDVSSLLPNKLYYYRGYVTNSHATSYSPIDSFTTLSNTPTSVSVTAPTSLNSYYATLNGVANPNGFSTKTHFRVFRSNPTNCAVDIGGIRFPELARNDINIGSGTTNQNFSYSIPFTSSAFLLPNKQYWYCAYAISSKGIIGAATPFDFTTPDGPASPCDPPSGGNFTSTANAACSFEGSHGGVDTGSGSTNAATITLGANTQLTLNPNQQVSLSGQPIKEAGSAIHIARGTTFATEGIFVHDKDRDGVIDSRTQYITTPPANATEFVRRNTLSANYNYANKLINEGVLLDCDPNSVHVYRTTPVEVVVDADNDGYIASDAPTTTACVGASSVVTDINGTRTYYKDSAGNFTWLTYSQKLSSTPDCFDNNATRPCRPVNVVATQGSDNTSLVISWSLGAAGPAPTQYNLRECTGAGCTPSTGVATNITSPFTRSTGLTCNTLYRYIVVAIGSGGVNSPSTEIGEATTSTCASAPSVNTDAATNKTANSAVLNSTINPNGASTSVTYRYQTASTSTCNSTTPTSIITGPSGLTGTSPLSGVTTQQSLGSLTAGTRYYHCATATNTVNSVTTTTYGSVLNFYTVPNAPTSPTAVKVGNQKSVTVSWTAPSGTKTGYKIYWCSGSSCTPSTAPPSNIVDTFSTATSYVHTDVSFACGGVYRYQVLAYNSGGDGALSTIASATLTSGSNVTCYQDSDNDTFAPSGASTAVLCGSCSSGFTATQPTTTGSSGNTDCYDANSSAKPGQTLYNGSNRGDGSFDYNCDNTTTKQSVTWCSGGAANTSGYYMNGVCTGIIYTSCSSPTTGTPSQACGSGIFTPLVSSTYYTTSSCSTAASEAVGSNVACR